jgi:Na+/proline symporter
LGGIVELTAFSGALYGACFFPALVLGLHWKRGSGTAVVGSFVTGIVVLLAWDFAPGSEIIHEIFPAMLLSTGMYVGLAIVTEDTASEAVVALIEEAGRTSSETS